MTTEGSPQSHSRTVPIYLAVALVSLVVFAIVCLAAAVILASRRPSPEPATGGIGEPLPLSTVAPVDVTPVTFNITGRETNVYVEYIMDASGSMMEQLPDGTLKRDVAKEVLTARLNSFPPEINIGLRAYGHRVPWEGQEEESCHDIGLIAPVETGQLERIAIWLQDFPARGMTPLAESIRQAVKDFTIDPARVNTIVMISDGQETCEGDPCEQVRELKRQGINFKLHVIGLHVDAETRAQLECIAQAGEGLYRDARNAKELNEALTEIEQQIADDQGETIGLADAPTPTSAEEPPTEERPPPTDVPSQPPDASLGDTRTRPADEMVMVYVPESEFEMGSTDAQLDEADALSLQFREGTVRFWFEDEQPAHTIGLDAFWIDRTEVTNTQYERCVEAGECDPPQGDSSRTHDSYYGTSAYDDYPVIYVSWHQAADYCSWAGSRLPTEAEWEYAARGPDARVYPWGDEFDGTRLNHCDAKCESDHKYDTAVDDGYEDTAPVGSYPDGASWCGALDMAGNVIEWVADWYAEDYYMSSPSLNPTGPSSGQSRVARGGSWNFSRPSVLRAAGRYWYTPDEGYSFAGFRCARGSE